MYEIINKNITQSKPLLLIDSSFLIFTRFFALRIWYKNAHRDKEIKPDHDWLSDKIFMEKYEKLFFEKILKICKKQKIPLENIIFAFDCSSKNNWRRKLNNSYKGTRAEAHKKNNFNSFEIFNIAKNDYVKKFCASNKALAFHHENLEADDIISFIARNYHTKIPKILIVANDHDYLQLCSSTVNLIDLNQKHISKNVTNLNDALRHLIEKICVGDVSDNIMPIYISKQFITSNNIASIKTNTDYIKATKKLVSTILSNPEITNIILNILTENRKNKYNYKKLLDPISKDNQFSKNQLLIDMQMIPYDTSSIKKIN